MLSAPQTTVFSRGRSLSRYVWVPRVALACFHIAPRLRLFVHPYLGNCACAAQLLPSRGYRVRVAPLQKVRCLLDLFAWRRLVCFTPTCAVQGKAPSFGFSKGFFEVALPPAQKPLEDVTNKVLALQLAGAREAVSTAPQQKPLPVAAPASAKVATHASADAAAGAQLAAAFASRDQVRAQRRLSSSSSSGGDDSSVGDGLRSRPGFSPGPGSGSGPGSDSDSDSGSDSSSNSSSSSASSGDTDGSSEAELAARQALMAAMPKPSDLGLPSTVKFRGVPVPDAAGAEPAGAVSASQAAPVPSIAAARHAAPAATAHSTQPAARLVPFHAAAVVPGVTLLRDPATLGKFTDADVSLSASHNGVSSGENVTAAEVTPHPPLSISFCLIHALGFLVPCRCRLSLRTPASGQPETAKPSRQTRVNEKAANLRCSCRTAGAPWRLQMAACTRGSSRTELLMVLASLRVAVARTAARGPAASVTERCAVAPPVLLKTAPVPHSSRKPVFFRRHHRVSSKTCGVSTSKDFSYVESAMGRAPSPFPADPRIKASFRCDSKCRGCLLR